MTPAFAPPASRSSPATIPTSRTKMPPDTTRAGGLVSFAGHGRGPDRQVALGGALLQDARGGDRGGHRRPHPPERRPHQAGEGGPAGRHGGGARQADDVDRSRR